MHTENRATYCPEDNKLRLYVGRVPRDEYEALRADGWTSTPKQDCDFVATWTPSRRDTALEYAGMIEDEDQSPEERAADRAERFGGYRDKRTEEAIGHADRYDAGPSAHGYQSEARAERAAGRHDLQAARACDAWGKAEYWTRRTAGVISHALHKSTPGVRMGRIKELEADLRRQEKSLQDYAATFRAWRKVEAMTDPAKQTEAAQLLAGYGSHWTTYRHPAGPGHVSAYQEEHGSSLYDLLTRAEPPITGAEACALYFAKHPEPETENEWTRHIKLRLAYENQMLEAQGGRAAHVEMVPGGFIGKHQIQKVNRSSVSGRVVSVTIWGEHTGFTKESGYTKSETRPCLVNVNIERFPADSYRPPTPEEAEAFAASQKAKRDAAPAVQFINPTKEDAEKLQSLLNARAAETDKGRNYPRKAGTVSEITQARFSGMYKDWKCVSTIHGVKLRMCANGWQSVESVVVLTDKPQKPLPAAVWAAAQQPQAEEVPA